MNLPFPLASRTLCLLSMLWLPTTRVSAATVERMQVSSSEGIYHAVLEATLDTAPAKIWQVLTDFPRFAELSPAIQSSEAIAREGPSLWRVLTISRACVLGFCKEMKQVQRVEIRGSEMRAQVLPEESDFSLGQAVWRVRSQGQGTRLYFEASMKPTFWVPPLLGPWIIEHVLQEELQHSLINLEQLLAEGASS